MNKKVIRTAIMAMLTALSIVSLYVIRMPLIPAAPFLEYDAADIPVLIGSMLLGPVSGIITLLAVCLIQALTVSASSGWIGFVMHFVASSVLVLIASLIYKRKQTTANLVLGLVIGSIAMTAVMIPLNLIFTGIFLGAGTQTVIGMLMPAIIPFNLLKAGINSAVTFAVFTPIKSILKKYVKK
jgi:riboflavin transporter FmnP